MRFYQDHTGTWYVPGKQPRESEVRNVPTTAAELCQFLNEERVGFPSADTDAPPPPCEAAASVPLPTIVKKKAPAPDEGAEALIDWMFDGATSSQACDIFLGLASRFQAMAKQSNPPNA